MRLLVLIALLSACSKKKEAPRPVASDERTGVIAQRDNGTAATPDVTGPSGAPCLGRWRLTLNGVSKCGAPSPVELYVVRDPAGRLAALRMTGPQDLVTEVRTDTPKECALQLSQEQWVRGESEQLALSLHFVDGAATATAVFDSDNGRLESAQGHCQEELTFGASISPDEPNQRAFGGERTQRELQQLLDELTGRCDLPALAAPGTRSVSVTIAVDERGQLRRLVIDGADQGRAATECRWLPEQGPHFLTNLTASPQTATVVATLSRRAPDDLP